MIIDSSIVLTWLLNGMYKKECDLLRKRFEQDEIMLRMPSIIKYEVSKTIATSENIPKQYIQKFIKLVLEYLNYISVELKGDQLAKAVMLSKELKVDLSITSCLVLANSLGELYVTANESLLSLRKLGYPIIHVRDTI